MRKISCLHVLAVQAVGQWLLFDDYRENLFSMKYIKRR